MGKEVKTFGDIKEGDTIYCYLSNIFKCVGVKVTGFTPVLYEDNVHSRVIIEFDAIEDMEVHSAKGRGASIHISQGKSTYHMGNITLFADKKALDIELKRLFAHHDYHCKMIRKANDNFKDGKDERTVK